MDERENIKLILISLSKLLDAITELQYKRLESLRRELQGLNYDNPKLMDEISEKLESIKKTINRELKRYWRKLDSLSSATCRL
ncbi:MAG: hypothetical protein ACTSXW_07125 [Candidatus Baldrarchaeia archaeon]